MKQADTANAKSRSVNITIPAASVAEAKSYGLNISQIARAALDAALREEKKRRYVEENREAIAEYNAFVEKHGVLITPMWMRDDVTF